MRILLTGAKGQLGKALIRELGTNKDIKLFLTVKDDMSFNSLYSWLREKNLISSNIEIQKLDITDYYAVKTIVEPFAPDVIINAAAYTQVDNCEKEREGELAKLVNEIGTGNLADISQNINAKFVYISTDYVFDGTNNKPYTEEDVPNPINAYGMTKSLGEKLVIEKTQRYFILRTAWLYGEGKNFVKTMLNLSKNKLIRVVDDQTGSPTSASELARFIHYIIKTDKYGIWNVVCEGSTTWYEFTTEIMKLSGNNDVEVIPIKSNEYKTLAERPKYSVLSLKKLKSETNFKIKTWKEALINYLKDNKELK